MNRVPPLHDLAAFEAAARHLSFLKASEELHVTQSAISHRIKSLEEFLGVPLFIRINRNIALTSAGERYLVDVRGALLALDAATAKLRSGQQHQRERLRISAAPALGAKWLVARLAGFQRAHPEIELAVSSSYDLELIRRGAADIGIRYGAEDALGLSTIKLLEETLFPVASAAYVAAPGGLQRPADLPKATRPSWRGWIAWSQALSAMSNRSKAVSANYGLMSVPGIGCISRNVARRFCCCSAAVTNHRKAATSNWLSNT